MSENEKKPKATSKKQNQEESGLKRWVRDMKSELAKVQWPTKKQTANHTATVLMSVLLVGTFIWVFDFLANNIVRAIINLV